jgi:hypothetical protein
MRTAGRSVTSGPLPARYAPASGEARTALGGGCVETSYRNGNKQFLALQGDSLLNLSSRSTSEPTRCRAPPSGISHSQHPTRSFVVAPGNGRSRAESCRSRSTGPVMPLRQQVPVWLKAAQGQAQHVESCINLSEPVRNAKLRHREIHLERHVCLGKCPALATSPICRKIYYLAGRLYATL